MSALGQKQTFGRALGMSAKCQKRTSVAPELPLFHFVYVVQLPAPIEDGGLGAVEPEKGKRPVSSKELEALFGRSVRIVPVRQ